MAADTQMTRGREKVLGAKKIHITKHFLVGVSGDLGAGSLMLDFVRKYESSPDALLLRSHWDSIDSVAAECTLLLVNKSGTIFYSGEHAPVVIPRRYEAIGSGAYYALGSMAYGASAKRAVKIASEMDSYTGGVVEVLTLEDIKG